MGVFLSGSLPSSWMWLVASTDSNCTRCSSLAFSSMTLLSQASCRLYVHVEGSEVWLHGLICWA